MKVLITGICGFVGSRLAKCLRELVPGIEIFGIDNLLRPGSETNREALASLGIRFVHGDLRLPSDVDSLPACEWVIDAAANPSVLAGVDGRSSPRQLSEHNLSGTLNLLEYCREHKAGFILLSTSRVYSVRDLAALRVVPRDNAFELERNQPFATVSAAGITEEFSVQPPVSLYGATKLSSEIMAREYGLTFQFPVWVNRCGVLAGAGQFGTAEQGIFSYWLHAHAARLPLRYIGFGGHGYQVRDAFHPADLAELVALQLERDPPSDPVFHVSGGAANAMSLAQLTAWCDERFGRHEPQPDKRPRPFDIPWLVMDHARAGEYFDWKPQRSIYAILDEIFAHVRSHPGWLAQCGAM
ncbi:MAG TPA: NAD-dependent epimerase/dehydratase family protein [Bryobacteraceae bacterium]|jgi:CDP-paratose 2-epimerase